MAAIASLSASVKSTPFVYAPSRSVVSKRKRRSFGIAVLTKGNNSRAMRSRSQLRRHPSGHGGVSWMSLRQPVDGIERDHHGSSKYAVFEHDVIEPMTRERRVGFGHEASRLAASCFCSVVLASHSSPIEIEFRCWAI